MLRLGTVVYWNEVRRRHCLECRTRQLSMDPVRGGVNGSAAAVAMSELDLGRVKTSEEDAGYEVQDWASQAAIAAMSGLIPTMFMTRVRL
jgi:hypothetical protein